MPISQAQIDAMKATNAQMASQINALVADPAPALDSVTLYDGSFFGSKGFRVVAVSQNGVAYGLPRPVWAADPTYTCAPTRSPLAKAGDICGVSVWGSPEYHRVPVATVAGQQWLFIDGYGPSDGSAFYPVEIVAADWINLDTNTSITVIPPGPAPQGQPYMPALVPASGHFRMRTWGWIWNSMTAGRAYQFYWEGTFTFGQNILNVAWLGDAQKTKPAFTMSEGWWAQGVWTRATGTDPFDAGGNPVVPTITYLGYNVNAKNVGTMWVYSYAPNVAGLESIHA
jgi:hypothetical protein